MSVEKRLLDDASSFADEVKDFDDHALLVEVLARLGIQQGLATSPASPGPAATTGRAPEAAPCRR